MVQLIASDIDGTLLQHGETRISPLFFQYAEQLLDAGLQLCAASGRQYSSLCSLFSPIAQRLYYICENGAVVMGPNGKVLSKTCMDRRIALQLCQDILQIPDCEILISGENTSYLIPKTKQYEDHIRYFVGNQVAILSSPEQMPEDFLKISAWYQTGVDRIEHLLRPQWEQDLSTAIAGFAWLDFTVADKGTGIRALSGCLGIPVSEMLAMGDNYNDVPMLDAVGSPVIMQSAAQPLLDRYPTHAARPEDILASLLREFQTC